MIFDPKTHLDKFKLIDLTYWLYQWLIPG